jgi:LysM repeat protein
MSLINLSVQQLRQAASLKEKIEALEKELSQILGSSTKSVAVKSTPQAPKKKGGMSAAGKARIAAAQKLRWAKIKAVKPPVKAVETAKPGKKARKKMNAAAKAKLSALAKARWAKVKATGKKKL